MTTLYILHEAATGYALFEVTEKEEVGSLLKTVQEAMMELGRFSKIVKLTAFQPFTSTEGALANCNSVSEGLVTEELSNFLEQNLPKIKKSKSKKSKWTLGVADVKLGGVLREDMGIPCSHSEVVTELVRGIRWHSSRLIDGLGDGGLEAAQRGLGHSYSRAKVKFNVNRVDNMIIQSICLLDQLDKDLNTFSMRIREWYGWHFPELSKLVSDHYIYARVAQYIGRRAELTPDKFDGLKEIVMEEDLTDKIVSASKSSMGMDIQPVDLGCVEMFAARVIELAQYRQKLMDYLQGRMASVAPNLSALIGDMVGARLINKAGSLINLAKCPASTVQILGAEKALFRALKTRGNTPKYGLIFHSSFIGRAAAKNKGRISRYLANKCSIASRIDAFSDDGVGSLYGEKMRDQVEERLKFYETGASPRKNVDVMAEATAELHRKAGDDMDADDEPAPKKKAVESGDDEEDMDVEEAPKKEKKKKKDKKKKRKSVGGDDDKKEKKKKKRKSVGGDDDKKEKKKKRKSVGGDDDKKEKKKKRKSVGGDDDKKEKKKKRKSVGGGDDDKKEKKKKRKSIKGDKKKKSKE